MQIGLCGLFGTAMSLTLDGILGITASWWILSFILMALSAAAVFIFFRRNPGLDDNIWRTTVAPLVSTVGLLAIALYATSQFGFLIARRGAVRASARAAPSGPIVTGAPAVRPCAAAPP